MELFKNVRTAIFGSVRFREYVLDQIKQYPQVNVVSELNEFNSETLKEKKPDLVIYKMERNTIDKAAELSSWSSIPWLTVVDNYNLDDNELTFLGKSNVEVIPFVGGPTIGMIINRIRTQIELHRLKKIKEKLDYIILSVNGNFSANTIPVKYKGEEIAIAVDDVMYFESYGNYIKLFMEDAKTIHLYRSSLTFVCNQLDANQFIRIHKSFIINQLFLNSMEYDGYNFRYTFHMRDGKTLNSGRKYKEYLDNYINSSPEFHHFNFGI